MSYATGSVQGFSARLHIRVAEFPLAQDFVHEIQEKKRLQAEAEQLNKMDNKFESSLKHLKEMKRNGSNATAEAKEEAAEEVKEDMMKLEMEVCNQFFFCCCWMIM